MATSAGAAGVADAQVSRAIVAPVGLLNTTSNDSSPSNSVSSVSVTSSVWTVSPGRNVSVVEVVR